MRSCLISLNDIRFLLNCFFKYILIYLNTSYLMIFIKNANKHLNFCESMFFVGLGLTAQVIFLAINCLYFMNKYKLRTFNKKYFAKLFSFTKTNSYIKSFTIKKNMKRNNARKEYTKRFTRNDIGRKISTDAEVDAKTKETEYDYNLQKINKNINRSVLEIDDFEYEKLIEQFFFKRIFYTFKKRHNNMESYILKLYTSDFNHYICCIKDVMHVIVWILSFNFWKRDKYDLMWDFSRTPKYSFQILFFLLSISYIDINIIILSYNKLKDSIFKSTLLIDIFLCIPIAVFFSKYVFLFDTYAYFYFLTGFFRNIKIFLNVSYMKVNHNSILTNIETKVVRIILGIFLLCNAFASTIFTVQGLNPIETTTNTNTIIHIIDSYIEYFYFAIISISTVGYGDIYPKLRLGKIVCLIFIFWTFIWVPIQLNDLVMTVFSKKMTYGKVCMKNQKFLLLIGDVDPYVLNIFLFESYAYKSKMKFHVLTTYPIQSYEAQIKLADDFGILLYIKNADLNEKENFTILTSLNAQNANHLFLLSSKLNHEHYNIDTKSFTRLLILNNFLSNKKKVLVELRNNCMSDIINSMGFQNFIIEKLKYSLILKNILCPGIITLILNLFTAFDYDYNYDITSLDKTDECSFPSFKFIYEFIKGTRTKIFSFPVHKNMIGLKFDKLFHRLYDSLGIILLGIETTTFFDTKKKKIKRPSKHIRYPSKQKDKRIKRKNFSLRYLYCLNTLPDENQCINSSNEWNTFNVDNDILKKKILIWHNVFHPDQMLKRRKRKKNSLIIKNNNETVNDDIFKYNLIRSKNTSRNILKSSKIYININSMENEKKVNTTYLELPLENQKKRFQNSFNSQKKSMYIYHHKKNGNDIFFNENSVTKTKPEENKEKNMKCYLNLLGKNYCIKKNDRCIIIANSKKVIKYLSKATDLFWLFEIKSKTTNKISYDLKSVIKTKQTFTKLLSNRRKLMPFQSAYDPNETKETNKMKTIIIENFNNDFEIINGKEREKEIYEEKNKEKKYMAVKFNDLFNYQLPKKLSQRIFSKEKSKQLINKQDKWKQFKILKQKKRNKNKYKRKRYVCANENTKNQWESKICPIQTSEECNEKTKEIFLNLLTQKYENKLNEHANLDSNNKFHEEYSENSSKKKEQIIYKNWKHLKGNAAIRNNIKEEHIYKKKEKQKHTNKHTYYRKRNLDELENSREEIKKKLVVESYKEAYEKYFSNKNNKLLFIINCTIDVIYLIRMITNKYNYNVIIFNDDLPNYITVDLCTKNIVFIKCKSLDDSNLINAGIIKATYILIASAEFDDVSKINEIDMNTIILTRKVLELLKKKKKTIFIDNIITELINPANAIFLDNLRNTKIKFKKTLYCDFLPYISSIYFRSSNIICETMLYNFMTHHESFTKFATSPDTLTALIKYIHVIPVSDLKKYPNFFFRTIQSFSELFNFLSQKKIIPLGLYRKGDDNTPFYVYTKPDEKCFLRHDDLIFVV